ncbi:MAG: deaminated glutathione amidase [Gluconacetobacter sp.]|uniref:Deaminated glutathione amidase n=1 Tax=Gluconacetobacter dulcium TaxID=2729096 RepID=A0A7W4JY65_9PROT|nr:deaminated glutathione amidase [Gluconacetobacter dulcium]MBB2196902.1 deaminated glutathione amidase [Gluconacetobacter dulcium]
MKIALGQFAVTPNWEENLAYVLNLIRASEAGGSDLLLLPEGILARDINDPDITAKSAQPLDGPFVKALCDATRAGSITVMGCIAVPNGTGRFDNTLIVVRGGALIAVYRKLHLYDAFTSKESDKMTPGDTLPPIVEVAGFKVGLMTCYDVRFPELARRLVLDGAEILVLPAAWVRGLGKEAHWETLVTARALENTCYMVAVGECGERNIGSSMVVDPLGVAVVKAGEAPVLVFCEVTHERIAHARKVLPVLENRRFGRPCLKSEVGAG